MSGPSKQDKDAQRRAADESSAVSREYLNFAREDRAKSEASIAPAMDYYRKLSSGDPRAVMAAAAPGIADLTRATRQARENIYTSVGPGAGRDFALASLERDAPSQAAQYVMSQRSGAFDKLANLGSGIGAFSLQELGGGMRAGESAVNTRSGVIQTDAQGKASTLGFLGSLAGAAGGAATGFMMKPKG